MLSSRLAGSFALLLLGLVFTTACDRSGPFSAPDAALNQQATVTGELELTDIRLHVSMIQLEGVDGTADWTDRTERILSIDPETGRLRTDDLEVAAGSYDLVRIQVHRPPGKGPSVVLGGTIGGDAFEVGLSVTTVIERTLDPPQPFTGTPAELTDHMAVVSDVQEWLTAEGSEVLDPESPGSRRTIKRQIRAELQNHARVFVGQLARGMAVTTTDDSDFPLLAVHENGSRLSISTDAAGNVSRALLALPDGEAFGVWVGENGLPSQAVAGDHIIVFGNYDLDAATVDIGVVRPDGTIDVERGIELGEELIQAAQDGDLQASVKLAVQASILGEVGVALEFSGIVLSGAGCISSVAVIPLAAVTCTSFALDAAVFIGEQVTDDPELKEMLSTVDLVQSNVGCAFSGLGCVGAALQDLGEIAQGMDQFREERESQIAEARARVEGGLVPGTEVPIATGPAEQFFPDISGDRIVWTQQEPERKIETRDIFMYDVSTGTETQITTDPARQEQPAISGNHIVWEDLRNGSIDVFMYDISTGTETAITTNPSLQRVPDISGDRIVWTDYRTGNPEVFMYDVSTGAEAQITSDGGGEPAISGNHIVYAAQRPDGNSNIFMYDVSTGTETQITNSSASKRQPAISGNRIIWADDRNGNFNFFMYDISTGTERRVTSDPVTTFSFSISGDRLVWERSEEVVMVNVLSGVQTQLTTGASALGQLSPVISGDRVVWTDLRNGNPDIFLLEVPEN